MAAIAAICFASGARRVTGQEDTTLNRPVTALYADGDRLLIGQGSILVEARITPDDVAVTRTTDLGRHEIRSITVKDNLTLVLSEDGLTTLDANGDAIDFAQGGGQRVAVKFGRIYIAAREIGVRILTINGSGKLTPVGTVVSLGSAVDVAPEGDSWLWVAEGDSGVRLYDAANPKAPRLLLWLGDLAPATAVRVNGPRLLIGHGNRTSLIDTINVQSPHLLSGVEVGTTDTLISDILIQGNRAYVGRLAPDAPDVAAVDISTPRVLKVATNIGESGTGEYLALADSDLFVGSAREGLKRFRLAGDSATSIQEWKLAEAPTTRCSQSAPANPQPSNRGTAPAGTVSLSWTSSCAASRYELRINGAVIGETDKPTYTFTPDQGLVTWQVTAFGAAGERADGPVWSFESTQEGWLATPVPVSASTTIYKPQSFVITLRTPGAVLAATCGALCVGALVVAAGAWAIGALSERRGAAHEL